MFIVYVAAAVVGLFMSFDGFMTLTTATTSIHQVYGGVMVTGGMVVFLLSIAIHYMRAASEHLKSLSNAPGPGQ